MDKIDAFLIHHPKGDPEVLADQLAEAVKEGLAETIGVSNYSEKQLREVKHKPSRLRSRVLTPPC
jgi:diketogulonate reductase-like aldo/keto reductase